MRWGCRTN